MQCARLVRRGESDPPVCLRRRLRVPRFPAKRVAAPQSGRTRPALHAAVADGAGASLPSTIHRRARRRVVACAHVCSAMDAPPAAVARLRHTAFNRPITER